jgi:hypothetical protein
MTPGVSPGAAPESLIRGHRHRHDSAKLSGVTHRSPSPDSPEMPCCGRTLLAIHSLDRVTTDPALVTCHGKLRLRALFLAWYESAKSGIYPFFRCLRGAGYATCGVIEASLIGHDVEVTLAPKVSKAHWLVLGHHSKVQISS